MMTESTEYTRWHRVASETVLRASHAPDSERRCKVLREAHAAGVRARSEASNMFEDMLALGLIHAVENMLAILENGKC